MLGIEMYSKCGMLEMIEMKSKMGVEEVGEVGE